MTLSHSDSLTLSIFPLSLLFAVSLFLHRSVERFAAVSARVRVFRRFATGAYPSRALGFYTGLTALLRHHGLGPLSQVGDNDEGVCWVELESIVKVLRQVRTKAFSNSQTVNDADLDNPELHSRIALLAFMTNF